MRIKRNSKTQTERSSQKKKKEVIIKTITISLNTWNINNCDISAMIKMKLRKMILPIDTELMNCGAGIWLQVSHKLIGTSYVSLNFATFHISHFCYPLSKVRSYALKVRLCALFWDSMMVGTIVSVTTGFILLYFHLLQSSYICLHYWKHTDAILCSSSSSNTTGTGNAQY